jgi:hypothetical protein
MLYMPDVIASLFHNHDGAQGLERIHYLLRVLLRHALLHQLRRALDELLAVDETQVEQVLDLLNDLGLGAGLERLELDVEQRLLLLQGRCVFLLLDGGGRGRLRCTGGGEGGERRVGDVQAGLSVSVECAGEWNGGP